MLTGRLNVVIEKKTKNSYFHFGKNTHNYIRIISYLFKISFQKLEKVREKKNPQKIKIFRMYGF